MTGTHVVLPGSDRPRKEDATRVRDVDPSSVIDVTVTLRGPKLPEVKPGETITRQELEQSYGASPEDIQKVTEALEAFGLKVTDEPAVTRSLRATGTAEQMEQAFHVKLGVYGSKDQGEFRGREGSLEIPAALEGIVTGVFGLDERRVARRPPGIPDANPTAQASGALAPSDLESRYKFPPGQAAGQTVAIAEFGGAFFPDDLNQFCAQFNLPVPSVQQVGVGVKVLTEAEVNALPPSQRQSVLEDSGEVNMDVQIVAGLCPQAQIVIYFANFDEQGWVDLVNDIVAGKPATPVAVSVSWGLAEDSPDFSSAAITAIDQRLQAAAAMGITFCVSAGDDGSTDQVTDGKYHVNFPASSPNVLAVGGTMIGSDGEVTWWQAPGDRADGGGSTGGGVSVVFGRPAWQSVEVQSLNTPANDGRVVPDIAALAGPPYYQLVFQGQATADGGTSASAPLWASLIARSAAAASGPAAPKFLAPLLYQSSGNGRTVGASVCTDITVGDNPAPPTNKGYQAEAGFDAVTGWGVPNGTLP
jgi:kumamolisin